MSNRGSAMQALDLSAREAAELLGCCERTVRQHKAEIGFIYRHGQLRFERADIEAYRKRGYVPPAVDRPTDIRERRQPQSGPAVNVVSGRPRRAQ